MRVVIASEALDDVAKLPVTMRARFDTVITRLEAWPKVSGAKPLKYAFFKLVKPDLIVVRIAHRSTVYED